MLEKLSFTSLDKNIEYKPVLLSVTSGATVVSYHWSIFGCNDASPTYWITTNGFGFIVLVANEFEAYTISL